MDHIVMQRNYKAFPLELNLLPAKRKCSDFFSSFQMPAFLQMATLMGSGLTYIPWQPHKLTFFFLDPPFFFLGEPASLTSALLLIGPLSFRG